ncbi:hypothetical protein J6590_044874 [Homalodisca vitripennis]|nr:hypothetical protein J6590_044874 [Homalodisca vitripennis]
MEGDPLHTVPLERLDLVMTSRLLSGMLDIPSQCSRLVLLNHHYNMLLDILRKTIELNVSATTHDGGSRRQEFLSWISSVRKVELTPALQSVPSAHVHVLYEDTHTRAGEITGLKTLNRLCKQGQSPQVKTISNNKFLGDLLRHTPLKIVKVICSVELQARGEAVYNARHVAQHSSPRPRTACSGHTPM